MPATGTMAESADIVVIGAGAAGLAAGIFAGEAARGGVPTRVCRRIVLLDGAKRIGAKILVSGGGRCNVTNARVGPEDFHGPRHLVRNILASLSVRMTRQWFGALGVELKEEEQGKLFPVTDQARTVLQALVRRCEGLGIAILSGQRVTDLRPVPHAGSAEPGGFVVTHQQGSLCARRVVLATGGRSLPRTGSDGAGWDLVKRLGHTVTPTYPALVPLVLDTGFFHAELSGLSLPVELTSFVDGRRVDRRTGSLLWTHFGVSGPVVLDASRFWTAAYGEGRVVELRCNCWPGRTREAVEQWLTELGRTRPRLSLGKALGQQVPERLALALCRFCGLAADLVIGQLPRQARRQIVCVLTELTLPVVRDRGWNFAEVTAGGVPLREINFRTMESRKVPGLYLAGELLDCDGRIGGFNFQWAWATGFLAGRSAVMALRD